MNTKNELEIYLFYLLNMSKVLLIGSGAREHVIAETISKSKKVNKIYLLPGNAGIEIAAVEITNNTND